MDLKGDILVLCAGFVYTRHMYAWGGAGMDRIIGFHIVLSDMCVYIYNNNTKCVGH